MTFIDALYFEIKVELEMTTAYETYDYTQCRVKSYFL